MTKHIPSSSVPNQHSGDAELSSVQTKKWRHLIARFGQGIQQTFHLMVGMPDYQTYLTHHQKHHSGHPPMSYETFFRERQEARYSRKKGRVSCC
jgi:uncharacterized short protein YbdD (DUF466 family)